MLSRVWMFIGRSSLRAWSRISLCAAAAEPALTVINKGSLKQQAGRLDRPLPMFRPRVFHLAIDDPEALGERDAEAPANPRLRGITLREFAKFPSTQTCARVST
jgi:hypothetical protein